MKTQTLRSDYAHCGLLSSLDVSTSNTDCHRLLLSCFSLYFLFHKLVMEYVYHDLSLSRNYNV